MRHSKETRNHRIYRTEANKMSIQEEIIISKDEILSKYQNLSTYVKNVINAIYGEDISGIDLKCFYSSTIINTDGKNNMGVLTSYKKKTGVYIFLDNNSMPVYIGVAGKIGGEHSIQKRLQKQFNCHKTNGTLALNIAEIEEAYGTNIGNTSKKDRKNLILNYAPNLLVICVGELENDDDIRTSLSLEKILISLFNSKYNK